MSKTNPENRVPLSPSHPRLPASVRLISLVLKHLSQGQLQVE
jgi:hypothetical protein